MENILEVRDLVVDYGIIRALKGIDLDIPKGKVVIVLGANGAGKTTMMRTISGVVKSASGSIKYDGKEIRNKPAYAIAKMGLSQSPEGRLILNGLTTEDNLRIGGYTLKSSQVNKNMERVFEMFPILKERRSQQATTLSGGESFLASLALALGLSDEVQMSTGIHLDTLFVDEGFGSLDEETLDQAMKAIQTLAEDGGRIVGIISHVTELQNRIDRQLLVRKMKSGGSTATINIL